ncbi:hypothetical protein TcasGA2_TC030917 [Tribolium castaneum]|uniref:Reverse transcriptase domain-containing protein n=1 Tax=Tribolium castaneum TaxID=7070 RepID=A0A139W9C9_TRICA|nr:hypothetical protein TcasGA2_TC030917 [Tribolium castaneum]
MFPTIWDNYFFFLLPTNKLEVEAIIKSVSKKKASGSDNVPCNILADVNQNISEILANSINNSFSSGVFPQSLKEAIVVPVYKGKGSRADINNYRPISLLPAFSKVFERLLYNRLYNYLVSNNFLSNCQHGFLKDRSTNSAIFETLNYIVNCLDRGESVIGIYFDLTKAFDTLDHEILLTKLFNIGVRGIALELFRSYLSDRSQRVRFTYNSNGAILNVLSEPITISKGVPQGSILGPLLSILYVNNLKKSLNKYSPCQFADDTSCIAIGKDLHTTSAEASDAISKMYKYCEAQFLELNMNKTLVVQYRNGPMSSSIYIKLGTNLFRWPMNSRTQNKKKKPCNMATVEEQAATIQLLQQQLADAQRLLTERGANANPPDAAQGDPPASGTPRPEVEEINSTPKLPPFWHKNPSLCRSNQVL